MQYFIYFIIAVIVIAIIKGIVVISKGNVQDDYFVDEVYNKSGKKKSTIKQYKNNTSHKIKSKASTTPKISEIDDHNEEDLLDMFIKTKDIKLKKEILSKVDVKSISEKKLLELINKAKDVGLVNSLLAGLKKEDSFIRVAKTIKFKDVKLKAIKNINDEDKLYSLLDSDMGKDIKLAALNRITKEDIVINVIKSKLNKEIKLLAYSKINNSGKLKELLSSEEDSKVLMGLYQANPDIASILKEIASPNAPLPIKLLQLESDFRNTIENTDILDSLFSKEAITIYSKLIQGKKENQKIKNEILTKHKLIKQKCNEMIENKEDIIGDESKTDNVIELTNIYNSYKDLVSTLNNIDEVVQFIFMFQKYSGIYNLGDYFYSERNDYIDHYIANNNLTEMSRGIAEDRYQVKKLDFSNSANFFSIIKNGISKKDWQNEIILKAWFDSLTFHLLDNNEYFIPKFLNDVGKELLQGSKNKLVNKTLRVFLDTDFTYLESEKSEIYYEDEFRDYVWMFRAKLG